MHGLTEPFAATIAWSATRFNLAPGGEARYAEGQYVSGDFFRVLGVRPWIGRTFTAEDDRAGCGTPAAVVNYAFWQRELGGEPGALGRELSLDGRRFPVIGVTPPQFFDVEAGNRFDVAVPRGTELEKAQAATIRTRLLKIGAQVRVSVRRVYLAMAASQPAQHPGTLRPEQRFLQYDKIVSIEMFGWLQNWRTDGNSDGGLVAGETPLDHPSGTTRQGNFSRHISAIS